MINYIVFVRQVKSKIGLKARFLWFLSKEDVKSCKEYEKKNLIEGEEF